jgi:hypothetical protein
MYLSSAYRAQKCSFDTIFFICNNTFCFIYLISKIYHCTAKKYPCLQDLLTLETKSKFNSSKKLKDYRHAKLSKQEGKFGRDRMRRMTFRIWLNIRSFPHIIRNFPHLYKLCTLFILNFLIIPI